MPRHKKKLSPSGVCQGPPLHSRHVRHIVLTSVLTGEEMLGRSGRLVVVIPLGALKQSHHRQLVTCKSHLQILSTMGQQKRAEAVQCPIFNQKPEGHTGADIVLGVECYCWTEQFSLLGVGPIVQILLDPRALNTYVTIVPLIRGFCSAAPKEPVTTTTKELLVQEELKKIYPIIAYPPLFSPASFEKKTESACRARRANTRRSQFKPFTFVHIDKNGTAAKLYLTRFWARGRTL